MGAVLMFVSVWFATSWPALSWTVAGGVTYVTFFVDDPLKFIHMTRTGFTKGAEYLHRRITEASTGTQSARENAH